MGYEDDENDELDELNEIKYNQELFPEGIEELSNGVIRETKELGNGVVSERIIRAEPAEELKAPEIIGEPQEAVKYWHLQSEDKLSRYRKT